MIQVTIRMKKALPFNGFTLIELLVVVGVIGILAAIGIFSYSGARMNSRDAQRKHDLKQIQIALALYRQDHGHYPYIDNHGHDHTQPIRPGIWNGSNEPAPWINDLTANYIIKIPVDPINNASISPPSFPKVYLYRTITFAGCPKEGQWYVLMTNLENPNDPDVLSKKDVLWCDGVTSLRSIYPEYPNLYFIVVAD